MKIDSFEQKVSSVLMINMEDELMVESRGALIEQRGGFDQKRQDQLRELSDAE
jgi:hypothetical protein